MANPQALPSTRLVAAGCLLISALPAILVPLALVISVEYLFYSITDLLHYPAGSASFQQDRYGNILLGGLGFGLTLACGLGLLGLFAIAFDLLGSRGEEKFVWKTVAVAGWGTALFCLRDYSASLLPVMVIALLFVPAFLGAAAVAALSLIREAEQAAESEGD